MLTIFQLDGINAVKAIMVVVFPDAVSPLINTLIPSASIIHRYAASIERSDLLDGSERSFWAGDGRNEGLAEVPRAVDPTQRDFATESVYEYGSRTGVYRLLRLF